MAEKKILLTPGSPDWEYYRERAKTDLYWFNAKVLNHESVVPMTYNAHYALCLFAERRTGIPAIDESRIQLIQVPRGSGKTTLITKGRTLQRLIIDNDWAAGIMNERQQNANAFLAMIKAELTNNQFLRLLFPELLPENLRDTTWAADRIIINRSRPNPVNPSVLAAGVDATVTGVHMNEWIVDDLLSEKAAQNARTGSFSEIEQLNHRIIQLQPLLTHPKQDTLTFIGTPWWPGDSYSFIEDTFGRGEESKIIIWNLKLPDGKTQTLFLEQKGELAIFRRKAIENGVPLFPERYDLDELDQIRQDDPIFFAAQYMIEPTAGGLAAFRPEYLREYQWENVHQIRYKDSDGKLAYERTSDLRVLISVDPAISTKSAAARSAVIVIGTNGRYLFMLDAWASRCSPTDLANKVLELYQRYRPIRVIIEDVAYQTALAEILILLGQEANMGQLPIYTFKTGSMERKFNRIAGLEPYFRKGLFYYHPKTMTAFFDEYIHFNPSIGNKTVDLLDALSFQREAWEHLGFLGNSDGGSRLPGWDEKQKIQQQRIREYHSGRRNRQRDSGSAYDWRL